jgi:putative permease
MENLLGRWFKKYFSDPEGVILAVLLVIGFAVVIFFGNMLAPVLASVVIAYLLEGIVKVLEAHGMHRRLAVLIVFSFFLAFLLFLFFGLVPLLSKQVAQLMQEVPTMVAEGQRALLALPEHYPNIFSAEQVNEIVSAIRSGITDLGQRMLSFSLASISTLFTLVVYLVLLPVLVFFFMKDKKLILEWTTRYLPKERGVAIRVWREMDRQIGNYVRGKFAEIAIVGIISFVVFTLMGLSYASLLGAAVGLSVVVPYIGAVVVTAPVLLIAFFQWGWSGDFAYLALAYLIIQGLDGNLLVPWLFSEAVNLHPIAIIVAILIFGGVWGFWGVFFAIPLATLVKAVIDAWPKVIEPAPEEETPQ